MRQVTHALLTRPPLSHFPFRKISSASFDLHVLSTPPAFILSQDQTLVKSVCSGQNHLLAILPYFTVFRFDINCLFLNFLLEIFRNSFIVIYCLIINVLFSFCCLARQLLNYITVFFICQLLFLFF